MRWGTPKGTKYGNRRTTNHSGYSFASKLEAAVYDILYLREKAGEIRDIKVQQHVYLTRSRIRYIADFSFYDVKKEAQYWAEAKGHETERWGIVSKLYPDYGPGPLEIWMGNYRGPFLFTTLYPTAATCACGAAIP